jgi:sterol desaturase/sphingolipid hydroxylase (fatty acid hydroxylase superfamily)
MTVASRGFLVDTTLLSRPTFFLLPILGVGPFQFIVIAILTNIWGIAQHTRLIGKLGWLDWLIATPSNHRVHHGCDPQYIDRNYGEILMIWDRLLGTYEPEREEPTYGVVHPIDTTNPLLIEVAGLRWLAAKVRTCTSWRDKVRCFYRPPEWQPSRVSAR